MAAKFEIYQDKANKYRFRLKAANGEIIAVGEAHEPKAACKNGIESIEKNAPVAGIDDQTMAGV
ncbi:YegP family protein [Nocardia sp. NPDC060256]|uniref:YegP family protein n=1 Tax=unclassified Nocardia TaxID=2637762 RepID=UPI0036683D2B